MEGDVTTLGITLFACLRVQTDKPSLPGPGFTKYQLSQGAHWTAARLLTLLNLQAEAAVHRAPLHVIIILIFGRAASCLYFIERWRGGKKTTITTKNGTME